jgi:ATP-dependent DNA helicase RecG
MAIPVNINTLLNDNVVESTRIEFKEGFNPKAVIHTICAFANDIDNIGGGYIVIGVREKDGAPTFPIKGIPKNDIDGIMKRLVGLCHAIEPLYNPIVEPVTFDGRHLIVIWVPGGHGRPYKACVDPTNMSSAKKYYICKFASTIVASPDEEKELFYVSSDIPFDDRPNLTASIDTLDSSLMREHLREIGSGLYERSAHMSTLEIARDMQLLCGPPEDLHPKNVGLLMFSQQPQEYFRYARIEVVDIPDATGAGMTERIFAGPIQRQLRDALQYIHNYVIAEKVYKAADAAEATRIFNYPYAAVEELLCNAVYHRSYQIAEPICVRIAPASLEITSYPGFDRSITDNDIEEKRIRARVYRNRRIGDFLKELRLIEGRNTGFPTVYQALATNRSPDPVFEMDETRGYLSVTLPIHSAFVSKPNAKAAKQAEYQSRVLEALGDERLTLTELSARMGYKSISAKLSRTVEAMVTEGVLAREAVASGRVKIFKQP